MPPVQVTAAVLEKDGRILLARRAKGRPMEGFWEFPGGKLEKGESLRECLAREIREELGVVVEVGDELGRTTHAYEWGTIELIAFAARHAAGSFTLKDHDELEWVDRERLLDFRLTPADVPLARDLAGREPDTRQRWPSPRKTRYPFLMQTPIPIAILCVVLFAGTAFDLAGVLMAAGKAPGGMFAWALAMNVAQIVSLVGLWALRRWAVYLYLAAFAAGVAAAFLLGAPYQLRWLDVLAMVGVPAVYLAVVLPYWKELY